MPARLITAQGEALECVVGEEHGQRHQPKHQEGQQQGAVVSRLYGHQQQQASGQSKDRQSGWE